MQADANYAPVLTHFLDPRVNIYLKSLRVVIKIYMLHFWWTTCERKRAIIAPLYFKPQPENFELTLFELQYPKKFVTIQHQHVLGTLMSLGIQRDQLGDIIVGEDIQFVLTKQLESYIISELTRIKEPQLNLILFLLKI